MPIIVQDNIFTIHTQSTTYQMKVDGFDNLLHLYYGARTEGIMDYLPTYRDRGFSPNPYDVGKNRTYTMDTLPLEFPVQGVGDFRSPLLVVRDENGTFGCDLRYRKHEVIEGKYRFPSMPAVYAEAGDEAQTLRIELADERLGLEVDLYYGVLPQLDIITRCAILRNASGAPDHIITVEKAQTACLDFVHGDFDLMVFQGRHAMERIPSRRHVTDGAQVIGSRRGTSSHQYNPFLILCDPEATETAGRCYSMQFVYSGGFQAEVSRDQFAQTRMQMGLAEEQFAYPLVAGASLVLPEVILSYSSQGLAKLSHNHHRCIRDRVCRGKYRNQSRPLLINSWEACYFDFTGEKILELARGAKELGVEMLVLDDGWFGTRDDDFQALGDWTANEAKLGGSLNNLIQQVNDMGLKFGIWMEPEMVSEDSELFRNHSDWVLTIPDKDPVRGRYQLVLDLSRPDVATEVYRRICAVLDSGNIEYLKWDCNRNISEVFSWAAAQRGTQGTVLYDYIKGLYGILEKLNQRYPNLLIEGCYGGGGRYDAGMLYYCPQIWCSDNTDPIDRLLIQYGTSFGYPASTMGAHVSASPNEQTGRSTELYTRTVVAMAGTFGYELDPGRLTEWEKTAIPQSIQQFHQDEALVREGLYYRLSDPQKSNVCAWSFVSESQDQAILSAVTLDTHGNMTERYVRAMGLDPNAMYLCQEDGMQYGGAALMEMGFPLPMEFGEYKAYQYHLVRV